MRVTEYCEVYKFEPTDNQLLACVWLEARGYEFLVDFGYENAETKVEGALIGWLAPPHRKSLRRDE